MGQGSPEAFDNELTTKFEGGNAGARYYLMPNMLLRCADCNIVVQCRGGAIGVMKQPICKCHQLVHHFEVVGSGRPIGIFLGNKIGAPENGSQRDDDITLCS